MESSHLRADDVTETETQTIPNGLKGTLREPMLLPLSVTRQRSFRSYYRGTQPFGRMLISVVPCLKYPVS